MTTIELTSEDEPRVEEFAGNLFMACLAAMELANVELGCPPRPLRGAGRRRRDDGRGSLPLGQASPSGTRRSGSSSRPSPA